MRRSRVEEGGSENSSAAMWGGYSEFDGGEKVPTGEDVGYGAVYPPLILGVEGGCVTYYETCEVA